MQFPGVEDSDGVARVVGARVDYLKFGFRVELDRDRLMLLAQRSVRAKRSGACEVSIGTPRARSCGAGGDGFVRAELKELRPGRWQLRSGAETIIVDEHAPSDSPVPGVRESGWTLEITYSGKWCMQNHWAETMRRAWAVAWQFGDVLEARFRRVDLCVDVENWGEITDETKACLVMRSRCKLRCDRDGVPEEIDFGDDDSDASQQHVADHTLAHVISGLTISPGNELMARLYSKSREFIVKVDPEKEDGEKERWLECGWQGGKVVRFEVQIRGAALAQLSARTFQVADFWEDAPENRIDKAIATFGERLDAMWAYAVGEPGAQSGKEAGWVRLVESGFKRRARGWVDARWELVRGVVFVRRQSRAHRTRVRTFARSAQGMGCILSILGVHDKLADLRKVATLVRDHEAVGIDEDTMMIRELAAGEEIHEIAGPDHPDYERALVDGMSEEDARAALIRNVKACFAAAAEITANDLIEKKRGSAKEALEHFVTKFRAVYARNWQPAKCKRFPSKEVLPTPMPPHVVWDSSESVALRLEQERRWRESPQIAIDFRVA